MMVLQKVENQKMSCNEALSLILALTDDSPIVQEIKTQPVYIPQPREWGDAPYPYNTPIVYSTSTSNVESKTQPQPQSSGKLILD